MRFNLIKLLKIPKRLSGGPKKMDVVPEDNTVRANQMTKTMYFADPEEVAMRVCSIVIMHDRINKKEVSLSDTWYGLGFSELDKIEIIDQIEREFQLSISHDATEKIGGIYDLVQHLSKNFYNH